MLAIKFSTSYVDLQGRAMTLYIDHEKIERIIDGIGQAVTAAAANVVRRVYLIGCKYGMDGDAFPGHDGGITIFLYGRGTEALEISIERDGKFSVSHQIGYGFDFEELHYNENTKLSDIVGLCKSLTKNSISSVSW